MARTVDRRKLAEWRRRLARHRTSGLTVAAFCRREGVSIARWVYWQRQVERLVPLEPASVASCVFQPVEIVPARAVLVRFPGGATLEIPGDRVDLVSLAFDRMGGRAEADAC
jgi:hypothetical protein